MSRLFRDPSLGGFFTSPSDGEALALNPKEFHDGAIPSGNSAALLALSRLAHITTDRRTTDLMETAFKASASDIREFPSAYPYLLTALDYHLGPRKEVVIVLGENGDRGGALVDEAFKGFCPRTLVLLHETGEAGRRLESVVPFVKEQTALDGRATMYVREDYTCTMPTTDIGAAAEMVREGLRSGAGG